MKTTHVIAHTRGHSFTPASKRDNYAEYALKKSVDNVDEAAKKLHKNIDAQKFKKFMREAFLIENGNYTSPEYANEWAERFNNGKEWNVSDYRRRHVLRQIFPEKYAYLSDDSTYYDN